MTEDKIERKIILKNFGIGLILAVGLAIVCMVLNISNGITMVVCGYVFLMYFTTMTTIIHTSRQLTEIEKSLEEKIAKIHIDLEAAGLINKKPN